MAIALAAGASPARTPVTVSIRRTITAVPKPIWKWVRVHLREFRHHIQHDVRGAECDVGQNHGQEALADVQEHEEKEKRDTGDDVRIEHRDIVQKLNSLLPASLEIEYSDSGNRPQKGGNGSCRKSYEDSVPACIHQCGPSRDISREQGSVQVHGKTGPVAEGLCLREGEYGDEDQRGIEEYQEYPDVDL